MIWLLIPGNAQTLSWGKFGQNDIGTRAFTFYIIAKLNLAEIDNVLT